MSNIDRLRLWSSQNWEATQVELHGQYTITNLQAFETYHATTSWRRAVLVCVLAPLLCIIIIVGIDLLPLEPPARGVSHSPHAWIRMFATVAMIKYCILLQFKHHIPQLTLNHGIMTAVTVVATATGVGFSYAMALVIGYPLPFHSVVGMPVWGMGVVGMVLFFRGRRQVSNRRLARRLLQYLGVFLCQVTLTVVYPVFDYLYSTLASAQQTGAILLLPIIKIAAKNRISRTLPDTDDAKPEAIVFNVEIFHALVVSICMGSTSSPRAVAALMVIDLIQAWLSFKDIHDLLAALSPISDKLGRARKRLQSSDYALSTQGWHGLVAMCNQAIESEPSRPRRVSPKHKSLLDDLATLNVVEHGVLVTHAQKLLFIAEFVVLIEYTEVIMPVIYSTFVVATWHLPNRLYYPNLHGIESVRDLTPTIANVQLYALLEFVSLVVIVCCA